MYSLIYMTYLSILHVWNTFLYIVLNNKVFKAHMDMNKTHKNTIQVEFKFKVKSIIVYMIRIFTSSIFVFVCGVRCAI